MRLHKAEAYEREKREQMKKEKIAAEK